MNDRVLGFALIAPTVVLLGALLGWPLLQAVILSFYNVNSLTQVARPVGLDNYTALLGDASFVDAIRTNFLWLFGCLALQLSLGMALALLLNRALPGLGVARALLLFPYLMPTVVTVLVWQWMLNDLHGIINALWIAFDATPPDWLGSMPNALLSAIVVSSWKVLPFVVLAVLARLQAIPEPLYEAARIDGASAWARFWDITLPQLRSVLVVIILLRAIWDFKEFDLIFLLTGGGPVAGTTTLPLLVYKEAFQLLHMGQASAIAVVMLIIMLAMIVPYFAVLRAVQPEDEPI